MRWKLKNILSKKWYGVSALVFVLAGILSVGAIAWAAMTMTLHGSVAVIPQTPVIKYTFDVYDSLTGGNKIDSGDTTYLSLGSVTAGSFVEKTIYIEKTGTGDVTVTPSATWTGDASGTITFTPTSVTVTDATRKPITIRFTAGDTTSTSQNFDITLTGSP
jgi:hypothetical protein